MKQNKWEERLEQHLADYEKSPSHDLWEGIESGLQREMKRQTHMVMLRRWMVAAALVGVVSGGTVLFWLHQQDGVIAPQQQQTETLSQVEDVKRMDDVIPVIEKISVRSGYVKRIVGSDIQPSIEAKVVADDNQVTAQITKRDTTQRDGSCVPSVASGQNQSAFVSLSDDTKEPSLCVAGSRHRRVAINLYASSGMSSLKKRNGVLMSPTMLQNFTASRTREENSHVYLVGYEERESHDQPISFGLTVSYPLTNRLSIGTGVVYTKLNSNFMTVMQDYQIHRHQTLHYVGIPLNLQYTLWKWHGLNTYLSAGGQADWNVKAKTNTDGVDQVMSKDRMQWSIGGSLGVQYNILPQLGVYAEPGIRYYFDNGSDVSNFFKDKPTDFHLELGLRFRWQ